MKHLAAAFLAALPLAAGAQSPREVRVEVSDAMRFSPAEVQVRAGERVRFVLVNKGKLEHEFVLGTMAHLKQHAKEMNEHAGMKMEHREKGEVEVPPGESRTLDWRFARPGTVYYGCLEPGHFEAGMVGKVVVTGK